MDKTSAIKRIKMHISEGETDAALLKFYEFLRDSLYEDKVIQLQSRYKNLKIQNVKGVIDAREFVLETNKINDSILDLCSIINQVIDAIQEKINNFDNISFCAGCTIFGKKKTGNEKEVHVLLIKGIEIGGVPLFSYVAVREEKLDGLIESSKKDNFYPEDYGVIIEMGVLDPSAELQEKMKEDYGVELANYTTLKGKWI